MMKKIGRAISNIFSFSNAVELTKFLNSFVLSFEFAFKDVAYILESFKILLKISSPIFSFLSKYFFWMPGASFVFAGLSVMAEAFDNDNKDKKMYLLAEAFFLIIGGTLIAALVSFFPQFAGALLIAVWGASAIIHLYKQKEDLYTISNAYVATSFLSIFAAYIFSFFPELNILYFTAISVYTLATFVIIGFRMWIYTSNEEVKFLQELDISSQDVEKILNIDKEKYILAEANNLYKKILAHTNTEEHKKTKEFLNIEFGNIFSETADPKNNAEEQSFEKIYLSFIKIYIKYSLCKDKDIITCEEKKLELLLLEKIQSLIAGTHVPAPFSVDNLISEIDALPPEILQKIFNGAVEEKDNINTLELLIKKPKKPEEPKELEELEEPKKITVAGLVDIEGIEKKGIIKTRKTKPILSRKISPRVVGKSRMKLRIDRARRYKLPKKRAMRKKRKKSHK